MTTTTPTPTIDYRPASQRDADAIARLHVDVFAGHTLALFGARFLALYYASVIESDAGMVACAYEGPTLVGFVVGMMDARGFYRNLLVSRGVRFAVLGIAAVVSRPRLVGRLLRGLTFHREHAADPGTANLASIGVRHSHRGRGIGRHLIGDFCALARERGADRVFLGVDPNENDTVCLYQSVGFRFADASELDVTVRGDRRNLEFPLR